MTVATASRSIRRHCAVLMSLILIGSSSVVPLCLAQEQQATLKGAILDPAGKPAAGFRAVFKDVSTGAEYTSPASNSAGEYEIPVPAGTRYQLVAAVAPDGTRFPVQQMAPLPVRVAGAYRLDVQFQSAPLATASSSAAQAAATSKPPKAGAAKPWWKTTPGITGIAVAGGAVVAAVISNANEEESASPSAP